MNKRRGRRKRAEEKESTKRTKVCCIHASLARLTVTTKGGVPGKEMRERHNIQCWTRSQHTFPCGPCAPASRNGGRARALGETHAQAPTPILQAVFGQRLDPQRLPGGTYVPSACPGLALQQMVPVRHWRSDRDDQARGRRSRSGAARRALSGWIRVLASRHPPRKSGSVLSVFQLHSTAMYSRVVVCITGRQRSTAYLHLEVTPAPCPPWCASCSPSAELKSRTAERASVPYELCALCALCSLAQPASPA